MGLVNDLIVLFAYVFVCAVGLGALAVGESLPPVADSLMKTGCASACG
jgi:hypothetical protein